MLTSYFSSVQVLSILFFALLHIISIYYFSLKRNIKYAMFFLFVGGLIARLVIINFDNYFHLWDEQYHALVAKNMAENPFTPMLFKYTPLGFDVYNWTACHVWLHKQPLFLWQMALSIKLFGATPFAVRLPSALMTSLLIPVIFRMGKLTINERVGYLASFLFATCNYLLDFNSGQYNTDHNDIAFIFYVTLSLWAYTEYCVGKSQYVWLIGFFAGLAILNKWLPGLVVFAGWGISLLFIKGAKNKISEFKNLIKAFVICILTFIPWQIYKAIRFPLESAIEYKQYVQHFTEPLDGHSGNILYYFSQLSEQYGQVAAYVLPLALIILFRDIKNIFHRISYMTCLIAVYVFFTISETKMPAFCLIVSPILFLALGNLLDNLFRVKWGLSSDQDAESVTAEQQENKVKVKQYIFRFIQFIFLLVIGGLSFNIEKLQANHTDWIKNDARAMCNKNIIRATEFGKSIRGKYDVNKTVIVNCKETGNIPVMFFSDYPAYGKTPTPQEFDRLQKEGYKIIYLDDLSPIPDYLANNPNVLFIDYFDKKMRIHLKASNGKYICADGVLNNLVVANRDAAQAWETFELQFFEKKQCTILAYNNKYLCAELAQHNEITAIRDKAGAWEIFSLQSLDSNYIALKAANGKYVSVDAKTTQLYAKADSIGKQEKFQMTEGNYY
jgi:hypothetical protein